VFCRLSLGQALMIDTLQCIDYNELMYSHGEDGGFYSYEVTTPCGGNCSYMHITPLKH
jgi:hypothetical protein